MLDPGSEQRLQLLLQTGGLGQGSLVTQQAHAQDHRVDVALLLPAALQMGAPFGAWIRGLGHDGNGAGVPGADGRKLGTVRAKLMRSPTQRQVSGGSGTAAHGVPAIEGVSAVKRRGDGPGQGPPESGDGVTVL